MFSLTYLKRAVKERHGRGALRWPRGKYNGQQIGGFRVTVDLNVLPPYSWCWPNRYGTCLGLGCLRIWFTPTYR